jgi:ketosteroid isomerase-like protein
MLKFTATVAAALLVSGAAQAAPADRLDEASVRAAENRWSEAFISGDAGALDALLHPDYVSVGATGKARPKAEIIAIAKAYAEKHPGEHAQPLAATSAVQLIGPTALVQHHAASEISVDLFSFEGGRWRARYSQHTPIAPPH